MNRLPVALVLVPLLASVGCNSAEKEARSRAELLCRYNLLEEADRDMLPEGATLESLVAADDVAWMKAQQAAEAGEDPFAMVAEGMKATFLPAVRAMLEVTAEHTSCEVSKVEVADGVATVTLQRRKPDMSGAEGFEGSDMMTRMGELVRLDSQEKREAKVEAWLAQSKPGAPIEHEVVLVREGDAWHIRYDLERKAQEARRAKAAELVAKLQARMAEARQTLERREADRATLEKFEVKKARFYRKTSYGMPEPVLDLTVKNGTDASIKRAHFRAVLKSADREVPWVEDEFNYDVPGGVAPGEETRWRLSPNMFSDWGKVEAPKDAILDVAMVRLDGPDGEPLWTVEDLSEARETVSESEAWIQQLQEGSVDPEAVEKALARPRF